MYTVYLPKTESPSYLNRSWEEENILLYYLKIVHSTHKRPAIFLVTSPCHPSLGILLRDVFFFFFFFLIVLMEVSTPAREMARTNTSFSPQHLFDTFLFLFERDQYLRPEFPEILGGSLFLLIHLLPRRWTIQSHRLPGVYRMRTTPQQCQINTYTLHDSKLTVDQD